MADKIDMLITPDLKTRESVMLAAGRAQFAVTDQDTGFTTYVRFDCKRKNPEGSDKRYTQVPLDEATHVFVSEKGYGTARLGTYYPPREGYDMGRFFTDLNPNHPHFVAINAICGLVTGNGVDSNLTVEVEDNCGMCGRKLTDPESIQRGIGPECAGKPTGTRILHASAFGQQQLDTGHPGAKVAAAVAQEHGRVTEAVTEVACEAHGDLIAQQVEVIREQIAALEGERAEIDARIEALRGQEKALMDEVPF